MDKIAQKNVESVINAMSEYYNHVISTYSMNLSDFINFMEPKFAEAGYRQPCPPPV